MTGAVDLAASAALHAGSGRVMTCFLSDESSEQSAQQRTSEFALHHNPVLPEIMPRNFKALHLSSGVVVCGCVFMKQQTL